MAEENNTNRSDAANKNLQRLIVGGAIITIVAVAGLKDQPWRLLSEELSQEEINTEILAHMWFN